MAVNVIDKIQEGPVKDWYAKFYPTNLLNWVAQELEGKGYELIEGAGIWKRDNINTGLAREAGFTFIDLAFPRPVDLHYHRDVKEVLYVHHGNGKLMYYECEPDKMLKKPSSMGDIKSGDKILVPVNRPHSFRPDKYGGILEMTIVCSGLLDDRQEVQMKRFDKVPEWEKYYKKLFKEFI